MKDPLLKHVKIMHSLFENGFMNAYRESRQKKRRRILPYLHAIYRRWYYSALVEETHLSPANIMESMCIHYGENPATCTYPILRTYSKVKGVDVRSYEYTAENHPVVADVHILMEYATPHLDLREGGFFHMEQGEEASALLSLRDPHYTAFLLDMILWMKLLVTVPALYVYRVQASSKWDEMKKLSNEEFLKEFVEASIGLAAYGLRSSSPVQESMFTEPYIRALLTNPMETDAILTKVFEHIGIDMQEMLEVSRMPALDVIAFDDTDYDMEVISNIFILGILFDRFFFTPYGYFLRLIRPMYTLPFCFEDEINDFVDFSDEAHEAFVAFFAPCSSYKLTGLGLSLLNTEATLENTFNANDLPFDSMIDIMFKDEESLANFVDMAGQIIPRMFDSIMKGQIYTLRVRLVDDPSMWIHIQISEKASLHELYEEVAIHFSLKANGDYSFFHDKAENTFAEYSSAKRANRTKKPLKSTDALLAELDFDHQRHMLLVAYSQAMPFTPGQQTIKFELELLSEKPPDFAEQYPRCARISKAMQ